MTGNGAAEGVASGLGYQLKVSIQEHDYNKAIIGLENKKVIITEGKGAGQYATIQDYNPETKTYTLTSAWQGSLAPVNPDATSKFIIVNIKTFSFLV